MSCEVIYRIGRAQGDGVIEVYGKADTGYEWRIIQGDQEPGHDRGIIVADSGEHGLPSMQYSNPSIALRDGMNHDAPPVPVKELHDVAHHVLLLCKERKDNGRLPLRELDVRAKQLASMVLRSDR